MSSHDNDEKGLFNSLKEKTTKVKDAAQSISGTVTDKLSDIKDKTTEHLSIAKELASYQSSNWKSEAEFTKKIFQHKDLILVKTDAIAIVLRKMGGNEEFLERVDDLTREGYRLVHQESVHNIPVGFGVSYPLGSLYYFQHVKYIGKT